MDNMIDHLGQILADSYAVYLKTQNYHWNVRARFSFHSLHLLFEEQYKDLADAIDELAERIVQLGGKAPASFEAYAARTKIVSGDANLDALEMIRDLCDDQATMVDTLNAGIRIANGIEDEGTADILVDRLKVHAKNKWMLANSL